MATQIPFSADGIQTPSSIVAETFNFTDGEAVSLRPFLREVEGLLVATTSLSMSSNISGFVATAENGGDYDVWFSAATGDIAGNLYVVGDDDDDSRAMIFAFNPAGGLKWKVTMDQIDGYSPESYAINFANDQVVVGFRCYDGTSDQVGILKLNPADGTVIESVRLSSPQDASPRINAMTTKANGDQIIVGGIYGEFNTVTNLTAQPLSGPGVLWLNDSDLPTPTDNGQWEVDVNGTWNGVFSKNEMSNVPTETVTGSGTGMTVYVRWSSRDDLYSYYTINNSGSGYNVPDRIRVRGSLLGGTDNTDITATATSASDVDANTVAVYDKATYPTMGSMSAGWHIIFPNGLTYDVVSVTDNGTTWSVAVVSNGVDFSGPGMYTGGGNDLFLYINNGYWGQEVVSLFQSPTPGKSRLEISDQNDFSTGGPYSVRYSLDSQAYIWTPNWQHTYGDAEYQTFKDVAVSTADEIYLLGNFNKEINGNWYQALLIKLDTNGDLQWAKYVSDSTSTQGNVGSVSVDLDGNVFVVGTNDNSYTIITKLDADGDILWQVRQTNNNNWNNEPRAAIDTAGNIYLSGVWYNGDYDVVSFMKFNGFDGSLMWARYLGNTEEYDMREYYDDDSQPMRVVADSIYYCGYCYDINDDQYVGVAVRLSTEGDGMGTFGRWVYSEDGDAEFETSTADAVTIDGGITAPTDGVTQSISGNSASVSTRDIGVEFQTSEVLGAGGSGITGVDSITFGDSTVQTTAPPSLGNYSFNQSYYNIPPDAVFNGESNDLTMNLNRINYNIGYNINYSVNNEFAVNSNTATIQSSNNVYITGYNQVRVNMNGREIWFMNYGDKPGMLWSSYATGDMYNNSNQLCGALLPSATEDEFILQSAPYIGREYCKFVSPKISYTPLAGTTIHANSVIDVYDSGTTIVGDDENNEMYFNLKSGINPNFHVKFINMSKTQNMSINGWFGSIWIKSGSKTEMIQFPQLIIPPRRHAEFQRFGSSEAYFVTGDFDDSLSQVSGTDTTVLTFRNEVQHISVTGNITFQWAVPDYQESWSTTIVLTVQNSPTITWPFETAWPGGTPPTITDGVHLFEVKYIKGTVVSGANKMFMVPHLNYA